MKLHTVISGGQTGADQAGLAFAKAHNLSTGGWMPKGWRTESGSRPDFKDSYGMMEDSSASYQPRTEKNVQMSDATVIFGDVNSPGCSLTIRLCRKYHKVFESNPNYETLLWMMEKFPILNVAGNRESKNPGVFNITFNALSKSYRREKW